MPYHKLATIWLPVEEMNELFNHCKKKRRPFLKTQPKDLSLYYCCVIHLGLVKITASTEYKGKLANFITFLDGREDPQMIDGGMAYTSIKKAWPQIPEIEENDPIYKFVSAGPMIGFNPKYNEQRLPAWGYDLNSAYAAAMLKGWIDASQPPVAKVIDPETEVGFDEDYDIQREGYCFFVFKKMPTPEGIVKWVNRFYKQKKEAKTKEEKLKAKQYLNYAVGMLQRKNPWLRAWIVASCNEYIKSLLDDNSLFWNTDSIISRVPRPDLEIGTEIGQWKLEHEGVVAYRGNTYQWNNDKPTYRGVPKTWFPDDYDLLVDGKPDNENIYEFNMKEVLIYGKGPVNL